MNQIQIKKDHKVRTKKDVIVFSDKDYKAAGGQGVVFCKDGYAYKIYHDPSMMIPVAKIDELSLLKRDNILAPQEPLFDYVTGDPIGFSMKYIFDTEFLCKIFIRDFRVDKNITPTDIVSLVKEKQETLSYIHSFGYLAVDYNEMNFLLSSGMDRVYFIDVDNFQTKNFKATAIMESIRDRRTKGFTELTDWFSWAVVTFQMYVGIHPYKGIHPKFKSSEWQKRMELGISVFDKDVKLPACCQDFSVIPKRHLDWYRRIFIHNERSIPPLPDGIALTAPVIKLVASKGDFIVEKVEEMTDSIRNVFYINSKRYIITSKGVTSGSGKKNTLIYNFNRSVKNAPFGMCSAVGHDPIFVHLINQQAEFYSDPVTLVGKITADEMMGYNNLVYTVYNGQLVENSFEVFGKLIHKTKIVCKVSLSHKVFRGVVVQDDFMKIHLAIPFEPGSCVNIYIKELDGHRVIDARYDHDICIIISEKKGDYKRHILMFDKDHATYTLREEDVQDLHSINFTVLPSGLCLSIDDEKLSLFNSKQRKEITKNLPFDVSSKLYNENMSVFFIEGNSLYSAKMK